MGEEAEAVHAPRMNKGFMECMNKGFMEFMRTYYPHVARETFSLGTILTVEENQEDDDPEDDDTW